jgi:hypothetical protein
LIKLHDVKGHWGIGGIILGILYLGTRVSVVSFVLRLGGSQGRSGRCAACLLGIEPRFLGHPTHNVVTIVHELSWLGATSPWLVERFTSASVHFVHRFFCFVGYFMNLSVSTLYNVGW